MCISKKYRFEYVACLPLHIETLLMKEVRQNISGLFLSSVEKKEAVENAACSKVCDLEDTIKIQYVA